MGSYNHNKTINLYMPSEVPLTSINLKWLYRTPTVLLFECQYRFIKTGKIFMQMFIKTFTNTNATCTNYKFPLPHGFIRIFFCSLTCNSKNAAPVCTKLKININHTVRTINYAIKSYIMLYKPVAGVCNITSML